MKKKNKAVKPMVANLKKITDYMKPKPDRDISLNKSEYKEPDTANQGSSEQNLNSLSYNGIRGGRKLSENLGKSENSLNLPMSAFKADL